ncbi:MAG: hypothetical protein Q9162_003326 [Coniocarpon cinnabarinum]
MFLKRKQRKQKPTAHISYDAGLNLIRKFLVFAGSQTIEDIQAFTGQRAPIPSWVKAENVQIPAQHLEQAAQLLQNQLGNEGVHAVGGRTWWQWRQDDNKLHAEWIEMDKDYKLRTRNKDQCRRSMLYIPGGAYYFGGVDAHRYQIQRHARKLQARVLAPRYRLAPQFPFPCGLLDCLAAYLYLLTEQEPETIVIGGDSAGGGMALSLLVIIRDQGLPMPAGGILLSPWVDLSHSFPSVAAQSNNLDYVPSDGFHHKPSMSWPPPSAESMATLDTVMIELEHGKKISAKTLREQARERVEKGKRKEQVDSPMIANDTSTAEQTTSKEHAHPTHHSNLFCDIDGKTTEIQDQIQFYAPNELLAHPLVSPVMQSTLGGLPPLCILAGGGELLSDEQIYLAHKAANPAAYPPPSIEDYSPGNVPHPNLNDRATIDSAIARHPPTYVQLQVWDDLCHVATTLSWTRPAKYMYRSFAQFGAWALARAQMSEIRILDDDDISFISSQSSEYDDSDDPSSSRKSTDTRKTRRSEKDAEGHINTRRVESGLHRPSTPRAVGRAGDPLPLFKEHMIRQRVTRHGDLYALDPPSTLAATTMPPTEVGKIKPGPVKKWMAVQRMLDPRFGDLKRDIQSKRLQQMAESTGGRGMIFTAGRENTMLIGEEQPPPTALAGRTRKDLGAMGMLRKPRDKMSTGLSMWSGWGSKHDEQAIEKEDEKVKHKADVTMSVINVRRRQSLNLLGSGPIVGGGPLDAGQAAEVIPPGSHSQHVQATATAVEASTAVAAVPATQGEPSGSTVPLNEVDAKRVYRSPAAPTIISPGPEESAGTGLAKQRTDSSNYPIVSAGDSKSLPAIVPFKLARPDDLKTAQASTLTLDEADGTIQPDSATLPPPGFQHQSIASNLTPVERDSFAPSESAGHLNGLNNTATDGMTGAGPLTNHSNFGSTTEISRPSTAGANASRPISPGSEEVYDNLMEAQPAQAQAVRISHARASSKGNIDAAAMAKLANIENEQPAMPNGDAGALDRQSFEHDNARTAKDDEARPSANGIEIPKIGVLHGAEKNTAGELNNAQEDSNNWADTVSKDVDDVGGGVETPGIGEKAERPGFERFVTADQL